MGSRGESKAQKTVSVQKVRFLKRKKHVWTIKNRTGPHSKKSSVPLGFLVRNMLGLAQTRKETKLILNSGEVRVNGTKRIDLNFPLGLFDVVEFPKTKKMHRIVLDEKGRITSAEMKSGALLEKVSKVLKKHVSKKGFVKLTTSDGFVLSEEKTSVNVSDSVKISLPGKKILENFSFSDGQIAVIIGGKHAGETGKIKEVIPGSMHKPKLVKLESKKGEFSTLEKYVCIVGDAKTALEMNLDGFEK